MDGIRDYEVAEEYPILAISTERFFWRVSSLLLPGVRTASKVAQFFNLAFLIQLEMTRVKCLNKYFDWRYISYLVVVMFIPLLVVVIFHSSFVLIDNIQYELSPRLVLPTINNLLVCLDFVAVYWVYGSQNVLNDIYVDCRRAKFMGYYIVFMARYVLIPCIGFFTIYSFLILYPDYSSFIQFAYTNYLWYSFIAFNIIPLFALLMKCKTQVKQVTNMKVQNDLPQLHFNNLASILFGCSKTTKTE